MESAGAAKYSKAFIQKKFGEMSRKPDMFSSPVDDESSDGSVSDIVHHENNVARLRRPGAGSITPNLQARSEKSHVDPRADLAQVNSTSELGMRVLEGDGHTDSGHSREFERPSEPKIAVSKDEAKYMARHKALNASNRAKSWEVIARECGIIASLNDITQALRRAGCLEVRRSEREARPKRSAMWTNDGQGGAPKKVRSQSTRERDLEP